MKYNLLKCMQNDDYLFDFNSPNNCYYYNLCVYVFVCGHFEVVIHKLIFILRNFVYGHKLRFANSYN